MLHIKELGPKGSCYLIMQHFSRPRYIIYDNTHKSDNYFLNITWVFCMFLPFRNHTLYTSSSHSVLNFINTPKYISIHVFVFSTFSTLIDGCYTDLLK